MMSAVTQPSTLVAVEGEDKEHGSSDSDSTVASDSPNVLRQPHLKPGEVDGQGLYRNSFGRDGKTLHTEIIVRSGALRNFSRLAKAVVPEKSHSATNFLITDTVVGPIYGELVSSGLQGAGIKVHQITVPADTTDASGEATGEPHKTVDVLMKCCDEVISHEVSKHSCVISLGGGVVNNISGVVASMVYRGIGLVHITTTSMGMLDAAIDFKQAVNHKLGKNLLGCYYPASTVLMDPEVLSTLSERHVLNGIAEALKHGMAQSPSLVEEIVGPLREGTAALRDPQYVEKVCRAAIEIKCPTLDYYHDSDFNEMVPQYGHAIGHAIEHLSWSGAEPLLHGEAVAIGMCVSAEIAYLLDLCDNRCVEEHYEAVSACGLPAFVPAAITPADIRMKIMYDKHFVQRPIMGLPAALGCLASRECGKTYAWPIEGDVLTQALAANASKRLGVHAPPVSHIGWDNPFRSGTLSLKTAFGAGTDGVKGNNICC